MLAKASLESDSAAAARGMMVAEDVPREVKEIEEGMKEVEPLNLRKGDLKVAEEEVLVNEEGKACGNVGREDAIVSLLS